MRIIFTGGGTLGPVTPLLAIAEQIAGDFLWIGTRGGPERKVVEAFGMPYRAVPAAKLRRYFDYRNFLIPFKLFFALVVACRAIHTFRPDAIVAAGGFIGVPVVIGGWLLGVPSLILQLDLRPGISNLLAAPFAKRIAVTFGGSLRFFPKHKTVHTGAPVRLSVLESPRQTAIDRFDLDPKLPTLLVLGGGTGAMRLNELIRDALPELLKQMQVIHLTGPGKKITESRPRYHPIEFLHEMEQVYAVADLVLARAGMGTITEVSALGLPTILVPLPGTDQVRNAETLAVAGAAILINQNETDAENLSKVVTDLIEDKEKRLALGSKIRSIFPPRATERIIEEMQKLRG